jgi:acetyltransferase-like isoleucine patch superfamily enzyme
MKDKIKNIITKNPKIKQFLLYLWVHPYSARTRWWARFFVYPFIIKRGKGSIIRRSARLDLNPNKLLYLGKRGIIEDNAIINNGIGDVIIGDDSAVEQNVLLVGPVEIGNYVVIGKGSFIAGITHDYFNIEIPIVKQNVSPSKTIVENDVWIGGNCVILQGIKLGTHSLVGSGSVVTKDVEPYTIVAGNPARPIKKYDFDTRTWIKI